MSHLSGPCKIPLNQATAVKMSQMPFLKHLTRAWVRLLIFALALHPLHPLHPHIPHTHLPAHLSMPRTKQRSSVTMKMTTTLPKVFYAPLKRVARKPDSGGPQTTPAIQPTKVRKRARLADNGALIPMLTWPTTISQSRV